MNFNTPVANLESVRPRTSESALLYHRVRALRFEVNSDGVRVPGILGEQGRPHGLCKGSCLLSGHAFPDPNDNEVERESGELHALRRPCHIQCRDAYMQAERRTTSVTG